MQQIQTHLSIFHDGQFFVAQFERWNSDGYSVYRKVLGAEPSSSEIWDKVLEKTPGYGLPLVLGSPDVAKGNPKRIQREAAKISKMPAASTKAQQALQASRGAYKKIAGTDTAKIRKQREDAIYQIRVEKKKPKTLWPIAARSATIGVFFEAAGCFKPNVAHGKTGCVIPRRTHPAFL